VNDRRSASDLGSGAEAALSAFPFPERDWESDARAIEARLANTARGSTDALLLAPPLPSEAGEPSTPSATSTPLTNSGVRTQSLAELARRSVEKKQENERQMARETLALAAAQRKLAAPVEAARVAPSVNRVAASSVAASSAATSSVVAKSKPLPKIALVLPALALAAAALIWLRHPEPSPLISNAAGPTTSSALSATPTAPTAPTAIAREQPRRVEDAPRGVDPSTLPADPADGQVATLSGSAMAAAPPAATSKARLKGDRTPAERRGEDPGLPPDPTLRPADSRGGELPAKPTTGAVQAALGSVMSGARHCVAGDEAPSSAVVVFGSDGRVQHVSVSGSAAGKSSATCIEAQLSRARVQPFAASSFSVNATVRPE